MGRPSSYSEDLAIRICERIEAGESLRAICRDEDMPDKSTVLRWADRDEIFRDQYARAMDSRADFMADEILDIADYTERDWTEKRDEDGKVIGIQVDGEAIQRSKLRVDTRKWLMSKMAPKKYGEKTSVEMTGKDGGPIQAVVNVSIGSARPPST